MAESEKSWEKRLTGQPDELMVDFVESLSYDKRLYKYDIVGSIAHAQMLAEQWEVIGVGVTVETASPVEVREALERRDFDAILIHLAVPGDPDPYPFWHQEQIKTGQNYAGFNNRHMSEII